MNPAERAVAQNMNMKHVRDTLPFDSHSDNDSDELVGKNKKPTKFNENRIINSTSNVTIENDYQYQYQYQSQEQPIGSASSMVHKVELQRSSQVQAETESEELSQQMILFQQRLSEPKLRNQ